MPVEKVLLSCALCTPRQSWLKQSAGTSLALSSLNIRHSQGN